MAKLDFPGSPSANQKYPSPAVAGQPVYTWDGEKWTSIASQYVPGTAPFESLGWSGIQINGGFDVRQEKGATPTTTSSYVCDGWILYASGATAVSANANSPGPVYFGSMLAVNVTSAAALAAGDYYTITQRVEGYRISRLGFGGASAQPITIGFWTAHKRVGVYGGNVSNSAGTRFYAFNYTQNVSWTWQYNTITIPGCIDGAWPTDNTSSMVLNFTVAVGSSFIAPTANVWQTTNYLSGPGQINGVAATSDQFLLTGVTVLPGTQAPTAAQSPNIMRPYDQELVTCRRYWQKSYDYDITPGTISSNGFSFVYVDGINTGVAHGGGTTVIFSSSMRAVPTVTAYSNATGAAGKARDVGGGGDVNASFTGIGKSAFGWYAASTVATPSLNLSLQWTADARL